MKEKPMEVDVFNYLDYRQFLDDFTRALKLQRKFNLRAFAKKAEIKAPGYLRMVIDGRRNLTEKTTFKFSGALELEGKQKLYFEKLVAYNQTQDPDCKKQYYEELIALRPRSADFILGKRQGRYFSRPYYVCVREMVALKDFKEDYRWIARRCNPPIKTMEAKEAIDTLLELGLLRRDEQGRLSQTENFIRTQDRHIQEVEAYHFHEGVLDQARHALGRLEQEERHYYALTLPLSKAMFEALVDHFYKFRDEIVEKVNEPGLEFEEVFQFNFQIFPITKKNEEPPP